MTENEINARIFKAFCDANRLTILSLLQTGEKCACQILEALKIGQPTLSHHMKVLCDANIVKSRKDGKWTYYSFNRDGINRAKELLDKLTVEICSKNSHCQDN